MHAHNAASAEFRIPTALFDFALNVRGKPSSRHLYHLRSVLHESAGESAGIATMAARSSPEGAVALLSWLQKPVCVTGFYVACCASSVSLPAQPVMSAY